MPQPVAHASEELNIRRFILEYKDIVDWDLFREDRKEFLRKMKVVNHVMSQIDFDSNLLFLCNTNCSSFVFLSGLSRPGYLRSVYHSNILKIADIFTGDRSLENPRVPDEDAYFTEQDIEQDIMCLIASREMADCGLYGDMIASTIASRSMKKNKYGKPLYSWIFYMGNRSDLSDTKCMPAIYNLFKSYKNMGGLGKWAMYDIRMALGNRSAYVSPRYPIGEIEILTGEELTSLPRRDGDGKKIKVAARGVDSMY